MEQKNSNSWTSNSVGSHADNNPTTGFGQQSIPEITLPKGGGSIRAIDEKFSMSPSNGASGLSIALPFSPSRNGFMPALSLSYASGNGNGPFGLGWDAAPNSILRRTDKQLPTYQDQCEADVFMISGSEDLVPLLKQDAAGNWNPDKRKSAGLTVQNYRPRIEGAFNRIEKIIETNGNCYWKVTSGSNEVSIYGKSTQARLADPGNPSHIYQWLLEFSYDEKGNCYQYEYLAEDPIGIPSRVYEKNRLNGNAPFTNTYLKRIKYGNAVHFYAETIDWNNWVDFLSRQQYLLELVFDYGDHDHANPAPQATAPWKYRQDPFSAYKAGFEIRTNRLCSRILMFHHFKELGNMPCLVSSLELTHKSSSTFTFLTGVTRNGYIRRNDGSYSCKSMPTTEYLYEPLGWDTSMKTLSTNSLADLPIGIDELTYQWTDLQNDGLPGILSEQGGCWYYKDNLGDGNFGPARQVASKPSLTGLPTGQLYFQDLEGNGQKQLVSTKLQGFYDQDEDAQWQNFRNFETFPTVNLSDPNLKFLDLDGDGRPDILLSEDEVFTWYPSKGKNGYAPSRTTKKAVDEERGPNIVFADATQSILLADMSGDGLPDIVRIRNSEIVYWPNLGYCRFGAKVTMDNAPILDTPENFNPGLIKLADLDGSGTTSLVYLGTDQFQLYFNQSGNSWSEKNLVNKRNQIPFPKVDELTKIMVIDLLGNGTASMVWSSALPTVSKPLYYIDLMGGKKPHLLIGSKNNMGKETYVKYRPSTWYFLQDKRAGNPWISKLPFPVHCVDQVEVVDKIAKTHFVTRYTYHHGYYDQAEREFRGFGRIEQTDTEDFDNYKKKANPTGVMQVMDEVFHQPPVLSKTWYHTGKFLHKKKMLEQYSNEYYQNSPLPEQALQDVILPAGLNTIEAMEALRSCKGIPMRTEVYTLDGSDKQHLPYTTANHSCTIRLVQPHGPNRYAVLQVQESEAITYTYDRNVDDPRVVHTQVLETDDYGNVLQSASITYGRKTTDLELNANEQAQQARTYIWITQNQVTNTINTSKSYHLPLNHETSSWELTGLAQSANGYFKKEEIKNAFKQAAVIAYDADTSLKKAEKRMLSQTRTLYLKNDLSGPLPLGIIESLALTYENYKLAYTPALLSNVFGNKVTIELLAKEGKYVQLNDANFWIPSGKTTFDEANFYEAIAFIDPFGHTSSLVYEPTYHFFIEQTKDALGNTHQLIGFNYRTLSPYLIQDLNENRTGVRTDELGMVTSTFRMGKAIEQKGDHMDTSAVEASAADKSSTLMEYDLFQYQKFGKPVFTKTITCASFFYDQTENTPSANYLSYTYAAGSGAPLMQKIQAEPGLALLENADGSVVEVDTTPNLRWIGNGRTILNNKGNPVKRYDPYFSVSPGFEDSKELVERGVSAFLTYDSAGRLVKTDFPDGTFTMVTFDAWKTTVHDQNNTVLDSRWYADRIAAPLPAIATPEEVAAATKAAEHANTPTVSHSDSLARAFVVLRDNGTAGKLKTTTELNSNGQALSVTDARGNKIASSKYGMLGEALYSQNLETGERWAIADVMGEKLRSFDGRGNIYRYTYDELHRPTAIFIKPGNGAELNLEERRYGEGLDQALAHNLRGKIYQQFTGAGITTHILFDFKGNLLQSSSQLCTAYQTLPNWNEKPELDDQVYQSSATFDAMDRPLSITSADQSTYLPGYNAAGALHTVEMKLHGADRRTLFIKKISYDVKGRPESLIFGNNTKTRHQYHPLTQRLERLTTTAETGSTLLQQLVYTYDAVGNITNIKDEAQQTLYFKNAVINPLKTYTYDAVYRLICATGREHVGQNSPPAPNDPFRTGLAHPSDGKNMRNYTQKFEYDAAGNMLKMTHAAGSGSWTRKYTYEATTNRLTNQMIGTSTETFDHDAYGNIQNLSHLQGLSWNLKDELQAADLGGGGKAFYLYAGGVRIRKVIERLDGTKEMRFYLGGHELYRKLDSTGKVLEETETLEVPGAARVETKTIKEGKAVMEQLFRYQYHDHLGSASLETDENGTIIAYEEYHPYGSTSYQAMNAGLKTAAKRYRYIGLEHDDETGLHHHGARYYLPWLGRWLSADPIGSEGGLNRYEYAASNPIMMSDSSGHSPDYQSFTRNADSDRNGKISSTELDDALASSTLTETDWAGYVSQNKTGYKFDKAVENRIATAVGAVFDVDRASKDIQFIHDVDHSRAVSPKGHEITTMGVHDYDMSTYGGRGIAVSQQGDDQIHYNAKHQSAKIGRDTLGLAIEATKMEFPVAMGILGTANGIRHGNADEITEGLMSMFVGKVAKEFGRTPVPEKPGPFLNYLIKRAERKLPRVRPAIRGFDFPNDNLGVARFDGSGASFDKSLTEWKRIRPGSTRPAMSMKLSRSTRLPVRALARSPASGENSMWRPIPIAPLGNSPRSLGLTPLKKNRGQKASSSIDKRTASGPG